MREYKFRGKIVDNGSWVKGSLLIENGIPFIVIDLFDKGIPNYFQVIPETVGQYTGLKDKNGKEIYEGDILFFEEQDNENGIIGWEVFYEDGSFMASLTDGKDTFGGDFQLQDYAIKNKLYCEIIGNIHDEVIK